MKMRSPCVEDLLRAPELSAHALEERWGSAALLRLPSPEVERAWRRLGVPSTNFSRHGASLPQRTLAMLRAFRDMEMDFLPTTPAGELVIGRGIEADLTVADPSVSKLHATLSWDRHGFRVRDNGSLNGTFVSSHRLESEEVLLDGDTLCLGDAQLVFVTAPTLFLQLQSVRGTHGSAHELAALP